MRRPTAGDARRPTPLHRVVSGGEGLRAGWGILLFLLLFIGAIYATSRLHLLPTILDITPVGSPPELPPLSSIIDEGVTLLLALLATLILSRIERRPFGVYGLGGPRRLRLFLQGLFWGFALLSLLVLVLWQAGALVFDRVLLPPAMIVQDAIVWAFGFLVVALLEETVLRGYLQFTLARGLAAFYRPFTSARKARSFGFWTAALVLCFLFGWGHSDNAGESPIGLVAVAVFGLTFVFSLWRTGSLWWAIGAHAGWDWAMSFIYGVPDSGNMVRYHLLASHPVGWSLLSGGTTGPEGSLFALPTLALLAGAAFFAVSRSEAPSGWRGMTNT